MKAKLVSWMLALIFCVVDITCADRFTDQKLIEIKTVDERGDERIRVVAIQSAPSMNRNVRQIDSKHPPDDEDSDEGSGDSNNDDVAHDEPIKAMENMTSVSLLNSITPSSTANVVVTITGKANDSSVASPTKQTSNISMTVHPTPLEALTSSSKSWKDTTLTITQVLTTSRITKSSTIVPEVKTSSTSKPSTTVETTTVTENKSSVTTATATEIVEGTTRPTEIDQHYDNITTTARATEITNIKPVESTLQPTRPSVIKAHQDPTEKPRKTLFGFVTVEILIALLAGALFSVLLVAFLVYRLKKRNEGSYELSETIALRPKELDEMGTKKEVFV